MKIKMINAEDYILKCFEHYNIIGFGEGMHGLENSHQFLQKMIKNKSFQETIDVIIVEFANSDYQDVLDKYIYGERIESNELGKVWKESTQSPGRLGEFPVYFQLLQIIRDVNLTLPIEKRIRVIGGDPAINWKAINTLDDYKNQIGSKRQTFPAELAMDLGINKLKKVLLISSGIHLTKITDKMITHDSITTIINKRYPGAINIIEILNPESFQLEKQAVNWPLYSIFDLASSEMGSLPAEKMFSSVVDKNGGKLSLFRGYQTKDLFDAFLFVGLAKTWKIPEILKTNFKDDDWKELNRRRCIVGMKPL